MNYQSSNANVVVFQRRGTDIIDWIINPADPKLDNAGNPKWESKNLTHLTTNGIEVAYRLTTYEGSPSFPIKDLSLSYSFLQTTKYSSNLISRYALDYLKHKLALTVHLKLFTNAGLRWTFTVEDRVGSFTQYLVEKQTWGDEIAYKTNYLLDARMYWQLEILEIIPIQLYIEATNLFNITYYDYGNIAMPKRWLKAGITIDVNLRQ